jgi:hypothetical protein
LIIISGRRRGAAARMNRPELLLDLKRLSVNNVIVALLAGKETSMGRGLSLEEKTILFRAKSATEKQRSFVVMLRRQVADDPDSARTSEDDHLPLVDLLELEERELREGVPWVVKGSRAEAASVSRSLRRLECRGLVVRHNPSGRTTRVRLTDEGMARANSIMVTRRGKVLG